MSPKIRKNNQTKEENHLAKSVKESVKIKKINKDESREINVDGKENKNQSKIKLIAKKNCTKNYQKSFGK